MKILVLADVHGAFEKMEEIMDQNKDCDFTIFAGDFETNKVHEMELEQRFDFVVRGNNDHHGLSPQDLEFEIDGVKFYVAHGDRFFSPTDYVDKEWLAETAHNRGAHIAIHGHDHKAAHDVIEGVHVFNPGSPSQPRFGSVKSYGIIEIENGEIIRIENISC